MNMKIVGDRLTIVATCPFARGGSTRMRKYAWDYVATISRSGKMMKNSKTYHYRLLRPAEFIEPGDEYQDQGKWRPASPALIGRSSKLIGSVRRLRTTEMQWRTYESGSDAYSDSM